MRKRQTLIIVALFLAYLASYIWLSRRGYAAADQFGIKGFYYFLPEDSAAWRFKNYGCMCLFYPLNILDQVLGTGRSPGAEPFFSLGGGLGGGKK